MDPAEQQRQEEQRLEEQRFEEEQRLEEQRFEEQRLEEQQAEAARQAQENIQLEGNFNEGTSYATNSLRYAANALVGLAAAGVICDVIGAEVEQMAQYQEQVLAQQQELQMQARVNNAISNPSGTSFETTGIKPPTGIA